MNDERLFLIKYELDDGYAYHQLAAIVKASNKEDAYNILNTSINYKYGSDAVINEYCVVDLVNDTINDNIVNISSFDKVSKFKERIQYK